MMKSRTYQSMAKNLEDIGRFKRRDLNKPTNLQTIFKSIRNYLAGNAIGVRRDEAIAEQMIDLILCKIFDEKFTKPDDIVSFRTGLTEDPNEVKSRILNLFEKVKHKYDDVLDLSDEIKIDAHSLQYVVGELQNYCLIESERDAIGEAFEVFITGALKGGQGQFFTPRNVIQLIVKLINPNPDDLVIDPACGSAGFLVECLRYKWLKIEENGQEYGWTDIAISDDKNATAIRTIKGIEVDDFLSKVAKSYMAIIGDGKSGIYCEDSLENPTNWNSKTSQDIKFNNFDIVVTNPPFGKDIKVKGKSKLQQFNLAYIWKTSNGVLSKTNELRPTMPPQVLFIERCLELLKDGGKMGIILPETFFHAPQSRYILEFIKKHNVLWIIDLPHNTFRPHNNAKTLALIIQKNTNQQSLINLAVAEEMGHDHNGSPIYRWDNKTKRITTEIWDDIKNIIQELEQPSNSDKKYVFNEPSNILYKKNIFVPRYYWNVKDNEVEEYAKLNDLILIELSQLLDERIIEAFDGHGSPPSENKGRGEIPYIRVKDVVNWEIYKDPTAFIPKRIYEQMLSENKRLRANDIIFVRRGSYRIGSVAMLSPYDTNVLLTRELLVLRIIKEKNKYNLNPYYLMYLMSNQVFQTQMFNRILIETTLPNIANRWKELKVGIHKDVNKIDYITNKTKKVFDQKWKALQVLNDMKNEFGNLTT